MNQVRRHVGTPINLDDRPRPIKDAGRRVFRLYGVNGSIVLVGVGVLAAAQGAAVTGLWCAVVGVVNAVATLATAFGIRRSAERKVTPLSDPRDHELRALVAVAPGSRLVSKDRLPENLTGSPTPPPSAARRPGSRVTLGGVRYAHDPAARRGATDDSDAAASTTASAAAVYGAHTPVTDTPAPARDCAAPTDSGGYSGGYSGGSGDGGSTSCDGGVGS